MALVIQSGEDEDIPEPPPDFPKCTSRPPSAADRYKSAAAFGSLQVLLVVLLIIVAIAVVALPVSMVCSKQNMGEATERTHLLQEDVTKI